MLLVDCCVFLVFGPYGLDCEESVWSVQSVLLAMTNKLRNITVLYHLKNYAFWSLRAGTKFMNVYVRPQSDTVPVLELGHLSVPVLEPGELIPVPELGPKIEPSSSTESCRHQVPELGAISRTGHDLCITSTPISALVPVLALVPEWGLCLCPCSGTYGTIPHSGTGA